MEKSEDVNCVLEKDKLLSLNSEEIARVASELTPNRCFELVASLQPGNYSDWAEKVYALYCSFKDTEQWEQASKALTLPQLFFLLRHFILTPNSFPLAPLFVGLQPSIFFLLMQDIDKELLASLRQESGGEPLQHQLTLLCHELTSQAEFIANAIDSLLVNIPTIQPQELGWEEILGIFHDIDEVYHLCMLRYTIATNALTLAWHTSRTDLIEKLMALKDQLNRYNKQQIGLARSNTSSATGLYAAVEKQLQSIYDKLEDSDPAIEALTSLKIWYLKDYWEIDLLPELLSSEELLNKKVIDENEKYEHVADLHLKARHRLEQAGLKYVGDLKRELICSKKTLHTYLSNAFKGNKN